MLGIFLWSWNSKKLSSITLSDSSSTWSPNQQKIEYNNLADIKLTELLSIETMDQYSNLMSRNPVNAYILLGLKVLQSEKVSPSLKIDITKHLQNINFFMFDTLKKNGFQGINDFTTKEQFSEFMFDQVFTGKALWKNIDVAEIIAGNEKYCKEWPVNDVPGCLANLYFFHAKNPIDAEKIDLVKASFWDKLTKDFFTMKIYE